MRASRVRHSVAAAAATVLATLAVAPTAPAATAPAATTGRATQVTYDSATLKGSVNPNGSETSYYFQYGLTRLYGGQTAIADAGAGTHAVDVALPIGGLQPLSRYHYRLVAVSAAGGVTIGSDRTLLTTKVPLSLAILASPNPLAFGGTVTVQGNLSGTGNGGREVVLQANPFPFAAFTDVGNPAVTLANGGFSFVVPNLTVVTQFRVVTTTNPPVISPVATEAVTVTVRSHVGRTRRPHFARIYGTVTPAENGMQVGILRLVHGRGRLVGGTVLRPRNAASSQFSRVVAVTHGVYRVLVRVTNGAQLSNYGQPLLIG